MKEMFENNIYINHAIPNKLHASCNNYIISCNYYQRLATTTKAYFASKVPASQK